MKWFFYSVPTLVTPSPYFKSVRSMLAHISRQGLTRFTLRQGTHDAPEPLTDKCWHSIQEKE